PSMASRISTKSPFCRGSSASSACCRPSSVSARIRSSTSWRRSPRNMCSVRTRPTPPAPNRRARAQSGPLSALARTPRGRQLALEVLHHVGRDHRDLAQVDRTGGAVDRDNVALADGPAVGGGELLALGVHLE